MKFIRHLFIFTSRMKPNFLHQRLVMHTSFWLIWLVYGLACTTNALSQPLNAGDSTTPYSVSILEDQDGRLSPLDLSQKPDSAFTPLDRQPVREGFTKSTIWLRVVVSNPSDHNLIRWLELSSPLLEEIHFFKNHSQDRIEKQYPVLLRKPAYRLDIPANITERYFIQIKTRTSMSTQVHLWTPERHMENEMRTTMGWNLMYGSYLTVLIFYFIFWTWSKEKIHLFYSGYIAINFLAAFTTEGWPLLLIPNHYKSIYIDFLGILISLVVSIGTSFTLEYLNAYKFLRNTSLFVIGSSISVSTICIALVICGYYSYAAIGSQVSSIFLILTTTSIAVYLSFKKQRRAYFFLIAFSPFYAGVIWRYFKNLNIIEPGFWNDNAYQFGAFFHMALMSIGIFTSYNRLRYERDQAQARAEAEEALRQQQNDFIAMLSHETRTPLSVILASAENICLLPDLEIKTQTRVNKIVNAANRIQDLLTNFIERERYLNANAGFSPQQSDLCGLALMQAYDIEKMNDVHIQVNTQVTNLIFSFDTYLIRIAIANLLQNSIHYAGKSASIQLIIAKNDTDAQILVSDNGPGIPANDLPFILGRYYRGSNSRGHGLGLYLVDQIAKKHGGNLQIENLTGGGCVVRLILPIDHATPHR